MIGKGISKSFVCLIETRPNLQFINFINKLNLMIAQKRFFSKSIKLNNPKVNRYFQGDENTSIFEQFQSAVLQPHTKKRSSGQELTQIFNNTNQIFNPSLLLRNNSRKSTYRDKNNSIRLQGKSSQYNIRKQSQYSIKQNVQLPTCQLNDQKFSRVVYERPKTSISQQSGVNESLLDNKHNIAFEQIRQKSVGERMSVSRALSQYSVVQKNSSKSRFKVKKGKNVAPPYLSARKIVFQVKQKKQKNYLQNSTYNKQGIRRCPKNVPFEGQDYELKGWDFE